MGYVDETNEPNGAIANAELEKTENSIEDLPTNPDDKKLK